MLGTVTRCLGGFFGLIFFTQVPKERDRRKKKRNEDKK